MREPQAVTSEVATPAGWIGTRVRTAREAAGWTQEDVAAWLRESGFTSWSRSSVAALETGRRDLDVSEVIVLPLLMKSMGSPTTLLELLDADGPLALNDALVLPPHAAAGWALAGKAKTHERTVSAEARAAIKVEHELDLLQRSLVEREGGAVTEVERRAARTLGCSESAVVSLARRLWDGRRLHEERDRRVDDRADAAELDVRARQARRGHTSRELLAEMQDAVDEHPEWMGEAE